MYNTSNLKACQVLLLSDKNKKLRLQFIEDHKNWTIKYWKLLLGFMSLKFCCDIWIVEPEFSINNMKVQAHPALSMVQVGGCNGIGDNFLVYIGNLGTNKWSVKCSSLPPCLSLWLVHQSSSGHFQHDNCFIKHSNELLVLSPYLHSYWISIL